MARSKRQEETYYRYRAMLLGMPHRQKGEFPGIRAYSNEFNPENGYNLHEFDSWSKYKKDKLRRAWNEVLDITRRNTGTYVFRTRNKENLEIAQKSSHGKKTPYLKVALVPWIPPKGDFSKKPRISFQNGIMRVASEHVGKIHVPFNAANLATNFDNEMQRVKSLVGSRTTFTLQCGAYETAIAGGIVVFGTVVDTVRKYMHRYDGVSPLPPRHGRSRDYDPKAHYWGDWLVGVNAYDFGPGHGREELAKDVGRVKRARQHQKKSDITYNKRMHHIMKTGHGK